MGATVGTALPKPKVSIGMPVHNGAQYLELALESLLGQEYEDFEVVLSDNASTDATPEICSRFARRDRRIVHLRTDENRGAAWNYNRVFQESRGEYFKWAAHDDLCRPAFLARCVEALDRAPGSTVVAYTRSRFIGPAGEDRGPDLDRMNVVGRRRCVRLGRLLRTVNMAAPVFGLIRRGALERTRLIGPFIASDYVLLAELAMLGEFVECPEELFLRRVHPGMSRIANSSREQVLSWFDPRQDRVGWLTDRQRLMVEYLRSVSRLTSGPLQRWSCYATVPGVMAWRRLRVTCGRIRRGRGGRRNLQVAGSPS